MDRGLEGTVHDVVIVPHGQIKTEIQYVIVAVIVSE